MACTKITLVSCPDCTSEDIKCNGKSKTYQQRYCCKSCGRSSQTTYCYAAWKPEIRALIVPMTMRNSGIRDIENVLGIHRDTVMAAIKTAAEKIPQKPTPDSQTKSQDRRTGRVLVIYRLKKTPTLDMVCVGCRRDLQNTLSIVIHQL